MTLSDLPGITPVLGYPNLWAMPDGRIVSTLRRKPKVLRPYPFHGHLRLNISHGGERESVPVGKLIALAFAGPKPSPRHMAIHVNGDLLDNRATNIIWSTPAEAISSNVQRGANAHGETHGQHKLTEEDVLDIRSLAANGATRKELAERFRVTKGCIWFVLSGRTWQHVGAAAVETQDLAAVAA